VSENPLVFVQNHLLSPAELSLPQLEAVMGQLMVKKIDMADLYFQSTRMESWGLEDGILKEGSFSVEQGVGIRAISGEKTGFAHSDDIQRLALESAAKAARSIATSTGGADSAAVSITGKQAQSPITRQSLYLPDDPLLSLSESEKIALLHEADTLARQSDPRIKRVSVSLSGSHEMILVLGSDGTLAADIRPLVRFNVRVIVDDKGRIEQGSAGGGGRMGYAYFIEKGLSRSMVQEAVRLALLNLEAGHAPAGTMPVVLGPGWPGVLLHEAIGHGLEGDFNRKGSSAFSGRIGERVASPLCTIVDDGTLPNRRGSLNMDDEGTPSQSTVLIERGILKGYLQDKLNAKLMNTRSTGNGRRESYASLPLPRMTNTYMLSGNSVPSDIIASVKKGLYAVNFGGGQVDITSGKFVFTTSEAYLIENGKITQPVKGATLVGHGPDILTKVSMVGNDLQLDPGVGTCGKEGQSVPVGVGQPTLKIDAMTVGGTNHE
jgi:TldD protein